MVAGTDSCTRAPAARRAISPRFARVTALPWLHDPCIDHHILRHSRRRQRPRRARFRVELTCSLLFSAANCSPHICPLETLRQPPDSVSLTHPFSAQWCIRFALGKMQSTSPSTWSGSDADIAAYAASTLPVSADHTIIACAQRQRLHIAPHSTYCLYSNP